MSFKSAYKRIIAKSLRVAFTDAYADSELTRLYTAAGNIAARQVGALERLDTLADAEFSIFSQWGEDGIIEWLVHHNGPMPEIFVEFGVETYRESSTRFLLMNRNWRGLIIDGDPANMAVAKNDSISWRYDLTATAAFITKDNINDLITSAGIWGEIGILSVDIDGNDYWVWDAIDCVNPHFVITEYNAVFGDLNALSVPYDPAFVRSQKHYSYLYYGASIGAMVSLAAKRGYTLLGTNRAGVNAFFVRNDRAEQFLSRIADTRPRPSHFREGRDENGMLNFVRGRDRAEIIENCPVVRVDSDRTPVPLAEVGTLYSERWLAMFDGRLG